MDTRWKKSNIVIVAMSFILGASLTLGGLTGILRDRPRNVGLVRAEGVFSGDYQQDYRFRDYITGRFWDLLAMASGGDLEEVWGGDYYYSYDDGTTGVIITDWEENIVEDKEPILWEGAPESEQDTLKGMTDAYEEMEKEWEKLVEAGDDEAAEEYREALNDYRKEIEDYQSEMGTYRKTAPTEEEKKVVYQKYHDRIKGDKNLLYTVCAGGQVLYANSELIKADGQMKAPEGYNFLLYFDGKKVRIIKDGEEIDVYGDGFYREEETGRAGADWYVPGYQNFPVDESMKDARVFLAVAKEPVLYMEGNRGNASGVSYDNSLYWMDRNYRTNRKILEGEAVCLGVGLLLLLFAFITRKGGRQAAQKAALFQGRIWAECKVLLVCVGLALVWLSMINSGQTYGWWWELKEACYYGWGIENLLLYGGEVLRYTSPVVWVMLFWIFWALWNDLRCNKKLWKNSLCEKLYRGFSARGMELPLAKRMVRRNGMLFLAAALLFALLLVGMTTLWMCGYSNITVFLPVTLAGLAVLFGTYIGCRKNAEAAKDMETVSVCIREIRNGHYGTLSGDYAGHDLQAVMEELEDIRNGLEKAVEEQMKSQKMKVELIANVSHDIKTPLTSIISYVQFLKEEEGLPEHVKDYVRILDEKSQRLKNMVQDVFAVSKAASGELPVHMEELDFGKLLEQTLADMEEQIAGSAVSFRTRMPQEPVTIRADGERMYRVFQNLFQNAIQYSLAGSRVYVTLEAESGRAVATVKNTSMAELDREKDFAERFTRGDASRTDGGSGLGLSIAQSFTEACGGEFTWETDADLFVVKVGFRVRSMSDN